MRVSDHLVAYTPSRADVHDHRALRAASRALNQQLVRAIPDATLHEGGDALGIRRADGVFVFPFEDATDVLMDLCIHGGFGPGQTPIEVLVHQATQTGSPELTEIDRRILAAKARAVHTVFRLEKIVPDTGAYAWDGFEESAFFLMDQSLGNQPHGVGEWFSAYPCHLWLLEDDHRSAASTRSDRTRRDASPARAHPG